MKKNYITSCLVGAVIFFSCLSYVFAGDKMKKKYIVTINEIEMYSSAATSLLKSIAREEKDVASIFDKSTGKGLNIAIKILKPEMNILIDNSRNMEYISKLFEGLKEHATKSPDKPTSDFYIEHIKNPITSIRIDDQFCLFHLPDEIEYKINLCINNKIQVTNLSIFKTDSIIPSETQKATPIHENYRE